MKNLFKNILAAVATASLCLLSVNDVQAQGGIRFDTFGPNRIILATNPTNDIISTSGNVSVTNVPTFLRYFDGIGTFFGFAATNSFQGNASNTWSCLIQTSKDTTNWNSLSNYAVGIPFNKSDANYYYGVSGYTYTTNAGVVTTNGTGLTTTNFYLAPWTNTTPVASTSGWATPYPANGIPYTNSGVYSNLSTPEFAIAWSVADQGNYVRVVWNSQGTNNLLGGFFLAPLKQ